MKYDELRRRLVDETGSNWVYFQERPDLTEKSDRAASWIIAKQAGKYVVGGLERNEFATVAEFASEDEACDFVYSREIKSYIARHSPDPHASDATYAAGNAAFLAEMDNLFPGGCAHGAMSRRAPGGRAKEEAWHRVDEGKGGRRA